VEEAAMRELLEETGYKGVVRPDSISPPKPSDPGMCSSLSQSVVIEVDLDTHGEVVQQLDEGENIDCHMVPVKGLLGVLKDFVEKGIVHRLTCCRIHDRSESLAIRIRTRNEDRRVEIK
jgi:8-oxo-dGTP pyrophosphatase MutT (NUDIX family)